VVSVFALRSDVPARWRPWGSAPAWFDPPRGAVVPLRQGTLSALRVLEEIDAGEVTRAAAS